MSMPNRRDTASRMAPRMVDAELGLESVGRRPLRCQHHPGIVDQEVQARVRGQDPRGRALHGAQRPEIERHDLGRDPGVRGEQTVPGGGRRPLVTGRNDHVRPVHRERRRGRQPEAPVGAGHHRHATLLPGNIRR
jgi:hypothetical protein